MFQRPVGDSFISITFNTIFMAGYTCHFDIWPTSSYLIIWNQGECIPRCCPWQTVDLTFSMKLSKSPGVEPLPTHRGGEGVARKSQGFHHSEKSPGTPLVSIHDTSPIFPFLHHLTTGKVTPSSDVAANLVSTELSIDLDTGISVCTTACPIPYSILVAI
jgi:hypothetical protein